MLVCNYTNISVGTDTWFISRRNSDTELRPKLQMDITNQNSDTNDTNLEEDEDQLRLVY